MGILGDIGALFQGATSGALAARAGYKQEERDSLLEQLKAEYLRSQTAENNARARTYDQGVWGNPVAMMIDGEPTMVQQHKQTGKLRRATLDEGDTPGVAAPRVPDFNPTPSPRGFQRALQGGDIADDPTKQSPPASPLSQMGTDVRASASSQEPSQQPAKTTPAKGVLRPMPKNELVKAVVGPNGAPVFVAASQAHGMTPYYPPRAAANDLTAKDFTYNGQPMSGFVDKRGKHYDPLGNALSTGRITPYAAPTITVLPGTEGNPAQGVVTHGNGLGSTRELPTVDKEPPGQGGAKGQQLEALRGDMEQAIPIMTQLAPKVSGTRIAFAIEHPMVGNLALNSDEKRYITAARTFLAGVLHLESGARLSNDQWTIGATRYLPMPGDPQEVIEQKLAAARKTFEQRSESAPRGGRGGGRGGRDVSAPPQGTAGNDTPGDLDFRDAGDKTIPSTTKKPAAKKKAKDYGIFGPPTPGDEE